MSQVSQQRVGVLPQADGTFLPFTAERDGGTRTQDAHARYQAAVLRGNVFTATATSTTLPTSGSTIAPAGGLILTNPLGSGKNLVILETIITISGSGLSGYAQPLLSGVTFPIGTGSSNVSHTTPLTVRNALLGSPIVGVGLADSSATLPTAPFILRTFPGNPVSSVSVSGSYAPLKDEIAGILSLAPGSAVSVQSMANVALIVNVTMTWEEVPI
jgi:hypothetical protein